MIDKRAAAQLEERLVGPKRTSSFSAVRKPRASWAVIQGVLGGCLVIVLNASTGVLTARTLLPSGRGELAAITLWPLLLAYLTSLGMPSSIIFLLRSRAEEKAELVPTSIVASFITGCIAAAASVLLIPRWLHNYSGPIIRAAQFFLLATPLYAMTQTGRAVLEASGLNFASNIVQVVQPACTLILLLVLLAAHHLNPVTAGVAYMVAIVPTLLTVLWETRGLLREVWKVRWWALRRLLGYGVRSCGVDILGALSLQVDQVIVITLLTPAAMGTYGVALSLSRMFTLFQGAVVTVLFPRASGRRAEDILGMTAFSARVTGLLTGTSAFLLAFAGPLLLRLVYGREYAGASVTLEILLIEVTVSSVVYIIAQAYMALGRPGTVSIFQAAGLALSIPLMLLLIPRFGINGAAIALLVSTCARFLLVYFGFRFLLKLPLPALAPRVADVRNIVVRLKRPTLQAEIAGL